MFVLVGCPWHSHALTQTRSDLLCYYYLGDPGSSSLSSYTPGSLDSCYDDGLYPNLGFCYDDYDYPNFGWVGWFSHFCVMMVVLFGPRPTRWTFGPWARRQARLRVSTSSCKGILLCDFLRLLMSLAWVDPRTIRSVVAI